MATSVFDLFKIGIGPSSSHTVGPMKAARAFAGTAERGAVLPDTAAIRVELFGSLAATGRGHGTDGAVILGLAGEAPDTVDPDAAPALVAGVRASGRLPLPGGRVVAYREAEHLVLVPQPLRYHPNGLRFTALSAAGAPLLSRTYFSVGGGFVVEEGAPLASATGPRVPHPYASAADLLARCADRGLSIAALMRANEEAARPAAELEAGLLRIWHAMLGCIERGCRTEGTLPGGLLVRRRAVAFHRQLVAKEEEGAGGVPGGDPLAAMDWVNLWALAVNEENAAGGRVVTAPTNGAAGIVPAVLHFYRRFVPGADDAGTVRFLLTAGAIGALYKENASISGAEVGCQGEVGTACSMAAAALAEVLGGTPAQVENAAEIAMEHNLGLTCDPVGGLVQIPCIERNAMAAVQAINAARIALRGDGRHRISLDQVIGTMRDPGADMQAKYKETALGGLATHAGERVAIGVNVTEC